MAEPGWTRNESPFHAGEQAIHARFGAVEQTDKQGRRFIRDYLTEQHRQFFAKLCYAIVGSVDASGDPWASIVLGEPGFIQSPDNHTLNLSTQPLYGDPLGDNLKQGNDLGLLGIELTTRRRNRMNGTVSSIHDGGFEVQVGQSFGNCPQYIQVRDREWGELDLASPKPIHTVSELSESEQALVSSADTFFIATVYQNASAGAASGVDVSHRGGKPGFVRIDDSKTITVPDFSGNCLFNTFGNIEVHPRAGLLFIDFDRGDLLYLLGNAEVIWDGPEVCAFEGAERLLKFSLEQGRRVEGSLPGHWSDPEFWPLLERTGSW